MEITLPDYIYPKITDDDAQRISLAQDLAAQDDDYLEASPYSDIVRNFLRPPVVEDTPPSEVLGMDELQRELSKVIVDLNEYKKNIEPDDTAGQNTYFRVKTGLIEKLVELTERLNKVKELNKFRNAVFSCIHDMEIEQRAEFLERLESHV